MKTKQNMPNLIRIFFYTKLVKEYAYLPCKGVRRLTWKIHFRISWISE